MLTSVRWLTSLHTLARQCRSPHPLYSWRTEPARKVPFVYEYLFWISILMLIHVFSAIQTQRLFEHRWGWFQINSVDSLRITCYEIKFPGLNFSIFRIRGSKNTLIEYISCPYVLFKSGWTHTCCKIKRRLVPFEPLLHGIRLSTTLTSFNRRLSAGLSFQP